MSDLKTRFVGNCPVCEGDFKLNDGQLVHHGYKRPGIGSIIGDCFAVGMEPYEVSADGCKLYKIAILPDLQAQEEKLARLNSGTVTKLTVQRWDSKARGRVDVEITSDDHEFKHALKSAIYQVEANIREIQSHIERMDARIAGWSAKPVRTFEEEASAVKAVKDAKRAVKQAERDAKVQAKIDTIAKRLDSSMKTKNANNIAYIFKGLHYRANELNLSLTELFARINRPAIWEFFGLTVPVIDGNAKLRESDPCYEANKGPLDKMEKTWDYDTGKAFKYWPAGK